MWFHIHEFIVWIHYWQSRCIQYFEFIIVNSVVKYGTSTRFNELPRITTQIFVMNSYMNWFLLWIHIWIEFLWIHVYKFIWKFMDSFKSTQKQLNTTFLNTGQAYSLVMFPLLWENASTAASFASPMGWKKFKV